MPLFKVTGPDRKRRILVKSFNLEDIITKGRELLGLPSAESYRLVLEEDKTEIDDFDLLTEYSSLYSTPVVLMMVPVNGTRKSIGAPFQTGSSTELNMSDASISTQTSTSSTTSFTSTSSASSVCASVSISKTDACTLPCAQITPITSSKSILDFVTTQSSSISMPSPPLTPSVPTMDFTTTLTPSSTLSLPSPSSLDPTTAPKSSIISSPPPSLLPISFLPTLDSTTTNSIYSLPWSRIVPRGFENHKKNKNTLVLDLIRNVARYMKDEINDCSLTMAGRLAKEVVTKYPKAFRLQLSSDESSDNVDDGVETLKTRIYDCARYKRTHSGINYVNRKKRKRDSPLRESQMDAQLLSQLGGSNGSDFEDSASCETTRDKKLKMADILANHQPPLTTKINFLNHASMLLRKNVEEEWSKNLEDRAPKILNYFRLECYSKKDKKYFPAYVPVCLEEMKLVNKVNESLQSDGSNFISLFKILSAYFSEEPIFTLVDPIASDEEILENHDSSKPILIVKGTSVYDEDTKCIIILQKREILKLDRILDGILCTLLAHYVCGYTYHSKKCNTWLFIQRTFLDFNGRKQSKSGRKVLTLINNIIKSSTS